MPLNPIDVATLSRLLDEAFDLEPEAVARWLAELPAGHELLRDRLAEMLREHRAPSNADFMADGPKFGAVDETVASVGDGVGPYRRIREIGRGGMGAVCPAGRTDGTLKRKIALKLPRLALGPGLAERIARERDIGVLLYELLSGHCPYESKDKSAAATETVMFSDEPALASSKVSDKGAAKQLRGELDAILAKALRRVPRERYACRCIR